MSTSLAASRAPSSAVPPVVIARSVSRHETDIQTDWRSTPPASGTTLHFAQDCEIYGEGDAAGSFFKVVSGVVRTCRFLSDGRRQIDGFHLEGDIFGLEPGEERRLSAEAVSGCTVMAYRRRGVEQLAAGDHALSRQMFSYAMQNMVRAQDHSLLLGRKSE
jgi:CRP/FNR family nitrogen fixation transcriptional regulator